MKKFWAIAAAISYLMMIYFGSATLFYIYHHVKVLSFYEALTLAYCGALSAIVGVVFFFRTFVVVSRR